mmetsp:Transcript_18328/g.39149  ORF Transcript_18328/g.39149 Transcript_18328/m.39149 type:complete len:212 (-) Transcript_18328:75-710(-)
MQGSVTESAGAVASFQGMGGLSSGFYDYDDDQPMCDPTASSSMSSCVVSSLQVSSSTSLSVVSSQQVSTSASYSSYISDPSAACVSSSSPPPSFPLSTPPHIFPLAPVPLPSHSPSSLVGLPAPSRPISLLLLSTLSSPYRPLSYHAGALPLLDPDVSPPPPSSYSSTGAPPPASSPLFSFPLPSLPSSSSSSSSLSSSSSDALLCRRRLF